MALFFQGGRGETTNIHVNSIDYQKCILSILVKSKFGTTTINSFSFFKLSKYYSPFSLSVETEYCYLNNKYIIILISPYPGTKNVHNFDKLADFQALHTVL